MGRKNGLVAGVGLNDAYYSVVESTFDANGKKKQVMCKYYMTWKSMLRRCYDESYHRTSYRDCYVCDEWLVFSNFKAWMEKQITNNLHLDKDILVMGNKIYSPENCAFVPHLVNSQAKTSSKTSVTGFIGVVMEDRGRVPKYKAQIGIRRCLPGVYLSPVEAHHAWQLGRATQIEDMVSWYATQECFRADVADALLARVWKLRTENVLKIITKEV